MEAPVLERVRESLVEKKDSLLGWLDGASQDSVEMALGPAGLQDVRAHLDVIESSIEQAEAGELGLCVVCHDPVEPELLEVNYTANVCITHFSEDEIRRLEQELELAQTVQRSLLPVQDPEIPGLEIAAFSQPAQIVGGDYFDFIRFQGGAPGIVIADVAGHGVAASLHMASIQAMLRSIAPINRSPAEVVRQLHELFIHNIRFTTFVTFFMATFDPTSRTLTYTNAGQNPPLVIKRDASSRSSGTWLSPTGPALGLIEGADFKQAQVKLTPGDLLVLYTDGITEAVDVRQLPFGDQRLLDSIRDIAGTAPSEVIQAIRAALRDFTAGEPLQDDTTLVVARVV